MSNNLLILQPADGKAPTKRIKNGKKKSYTAGKSFIFQTVDYENQEGYHELIQDLLKDTARFFVLGKAADHVEDGKKYPRWKKDRDEGNATILDRSGQEMALDLDDILIDGFDALDPKAGINAWLDEQGIDCDVTWQITSSQEVGSHEARIRLYFLLKDPASLIARKKFAVSIGCDGSPFVCSQPIYTAPPIYEDAEDAIPTRYGFIKGKKTHYALPKIEIIEKVYERVSSGSDYDFDEIDLPEDVLSGKVYRRYFMAKAFHYANKGLSRQDIFMLIQIQSAQIKNREFSEENVLAYIDDAIRKITFENKPPEFKIVDDVGEASTVLAPKLDDDVLMPPDTVIGELTKALLNMWWIPNTMGASLAAKATVAFLAGGKYRSVAGDRVNIQQVLIGESGTGKDIMMQAVYKIINYVFEDDDDMLEDLISRVISEAGSAEGVDRKMRMSNRHDLIFTQDEMGGLLQEAASQSHKQGILNYALKMYSRSDDQLAERALAGKKDPSIKMAEILYAPHFIISGATTPKLITRGLDYGFIEHGNASRMMFFNADTYRLPRLRGSEIEEFKISDELKIAIKTIAKHDSIEKDGMPPHRLPRARISNPVKVDIEEGAEEYLHNVAISCDDKKGDFAVIWNRLVVNAKKYAMICAILENPVKPVIDLELAKREVEFVRNACEYTEELFKNKVSDGKFDAATQAVMEVAYKIGEGQWIRAPEFKKPNPVKVLSVREKNEILAGLVQDGYLFKMPEEESRKMKGQRGPIPEFFMWSGKKI